MALEEYRRKRDFKATPEPAGKVGRSKVPKLSFVIQKHAATRLHYDFRLEMEGVLRSWAVPKGPSLDPGEKRLAVHVEDHPLDYGDFEGVIPKGQYGGGTVLLWDHGVWHPEDDPVAAYKKGTIKFSLEGEKLQGRWMLVRMHGDRAGEDKENWLLIKEKDETAVPGSGEAVVEDNPLSVTSGLSIEEIAANPDRVWQSNRAESAKGGGNDDFNAKLLAKADAVKKPAGNNKSKKTTAKKAAARPEVPGARKAAFPSPGNVEAQLATLVSEAPRGEEWIHEIKYDGYRALCHAHEGKVRLITRNGKDWTDRFQPVATAVAAALGDREAVLDGEVVVLEPNGTSSFQALQNALSENRGGDLVYYAFDLLYLDGYDLRKAPLLARKEALIGLLSGLDPEGSIRPSGHVEGRVVVLFFQNYPPTPTSHQHSGIIKSAWASFPRALRACNDPVTRRLRGRLAALGARSSQGSILIRRVWLQLALWLNGWTKPQDHTAGVTVSMRSQHRRPVSAIPGMELLKIKVLVIVFIIAAVALFIAVI